MIVIILIRGTLYARSSTLVLVVGLALVLPPSVFVLRVKVDHRALLGAVRNYDLLSGRQTLLERGNGCWVDGRGEVYEELDYQTTLVERILPHWHTLARDALQVAVLYYAAWCRRHHEVSLVQGLNDSGEAAQCLDELEVHSHYEVAMGSPEKKMILLIHDSMMTNNIFCSLSSL